MKLAALLLTILVTAQPAIANSDLVLQDKRILLIDRPVAVVVTEQAAQFCDGRGEVFACAKNAYGSGRCIVYIRPDKMQFLYHEIQHCQHTQHTEKGD